MTNQIKMPVVCTKLKVINDFPYNDQNYKKEFMFDSPKDISSKKYPLKSIFKSYDLKACSDTKVSTDTEGLTAVLYKRRFVVLFLFCLCSMLNAFQFIQYSIISNIIECYYGVSAFEVNWTSTVYMISYGVLVFPVSWFLNRFNIRATLLMGCLLNCMSAILQCLSMNRDGFPIVLFSQTLAAIAQVFILPLPPTIAAVWFHPTQVGRVTAVGVIGNQLGVAVGFIVSPMAVTNDCSDPGLIRHERSVLTAVFTAINIMNFLLLLLLFKDKPPLPSSQTTHAETQTSFKDSLKNLMKNYNFLALLIIYGIITGVAVAIATLLNQLLVPMYEDSEQEVGWVGLCTVFGGIFSSFFAGYATDATHKYKGVSMCIFALSFLTMSSVTGSMFFHQKWILYMTVVINGVILVSYFPVGIDFAAEITYPEQEGTTAGLMNASSMILSAVITMLGSFILQSKGALEACLFFCGTILAACIVGALMKPELRRLKATAQAILPEKPKGCSN